MTRKQTMGALLAAFILGVYLTVLWFAGARMIEAERWTCQRYSPTTGECVLLKHKDYQ
jgi:hypothetical protein